MVLGKKIELLLLVSFLLCSCLQESRILYINKISSKFVTSLHFYRDLFEFSCPCGLGKTGVIFLTNSDSSSY